MTIKTYSELSQLETFEERFLYLKMSGVIGEETFGFDRYLNQNFYRSDEWKKIRDEIIVRDQACDLGIPGRDIFSRIMIHHMNPITKKDLLNRTEFVYDPEYLICVSKRTHDAIHYSDESILMLDPITRTRHDMCPWKE